MQASLDYSGKVIIVTGGGKGVGRGISERFLSLGATVFICGRTTPEKLPQVGENIAMSAMSMPF